MKLYLSPMSIRPKGIGKTVYDKLFDKEDKKSKKPKQKPKSKPWRDRDNVQKTG